MIARNGTGAAEGVLERIERAASELGELVPRLEMAVERLEPADAISIPEAARRLSVHPDTIRKLIDKGELDAIHIATAVRVKVSSIARMLDGGEG